MQLQAWGPDSPLISIAGRSQCGTSHLHKLLASHRDVFSLQKEQCPESLGIEEGLFAQFLDFTASRAQAEGGSWLRMEREQVREACVNRFPDSADNCTALYEGSVSGGSEKATRVLQSCSDTTSVLRMQKGVPVNTKVLFLQRDPADTLWSSYNSWQDQFDQAPGLHQALANASRTHHFPTDSTNYRSPRHFHQLVESQGKLVGGVNDWSAYMMTFRMHQLKGTFGADRVLFLRSEDLHLRDTVQKICDFVGLDIGGIAPELIEERTNSRSSTNSSGGEQQQGRYEVSGFKPMYCKTRELIYNHTRAICSELDRDFGLHYPECLGLAGGGDCSDGS